MTDYLTLFYKSYPLLLQGTLMTLQVLFASACISFLLGTVFGILSCSRLRVKGVSFAVEIIAFVLRAVPFIVQLLIVYYVLPDLLGYDLEPFSAAILALGTCSSGYVMQIVRAGIDAVPESQWEAAYCLGYSRFETLLHVILPQAWKIVIPACTNEIDSLLKSTAVVSSIGMLELTRMGMNIVSREMQPVPVYLTVAFFYLCMSAVFNLITKKLEKRISYATR